MRATELFGDVNGDGHGAQKDRRFHLPLLEANGKSEREVPTGIILVGSWATA